MDSLGALVSAVLQTDSRYITVKQERLSYPIFWLRIVAVDNSNYSCLIETRMLIGVTSGSPTCMHEV